jgi:glycolate oxidase iron-sulfur subunit
MRAFDEGRADITPSFEQHMFRCLDCRACETACPSGVQFGHMMEEMRAKVVSKRPTSWITSFIMRHVFPYPRRFAAAARAMELYQVSGFQQFLRTSGLLKRLAPKMAETEALMPAIGIEPGTTPGATYRADGHRHGTVALFTGCVMDSVLGSINRDTVRLLNAAGYDVVVPEDQICCGALANHAGLRDTAIEMAKRNIQAFPLDDVDAIIINAAGCGAMLKEYPVLLDNAGRFSSKVQDISEFLVSTRIFDRLNIPQRGRVGYDDPCHLIHGQGVKSQPRRLLKSIPGIEFVEIEGADQCCGSAGIYNITQNELSMQILDRKMEQIRKANVNTLATGNPGCMFQFRYGAVRAGIDLQVVHPVELLARSLD